MSDVRQHKQDCERYLGAGYGPVHVWMDACFAQIGPTHRSIRHHFEGVREAAALFGHRGGVAALLHVLRDCLNLPRKSDYKNKVVDALGIPGTMTIEDVIGFGEEKLMDLMKRHLGSDQKADILVWGWLPVKSDVSDLLNAVTQDPGASLDDISGRWEAAKVHLSASVFEPEAARYASDEYTASLNGFHDVKEALTRYHSDVRFGFVSSATLINPLMIVDREFVDFLREELQEPPSENAAVAFAFPDKINVKVQLLSDSRSATVITRFHQFALSNVASEAAKDSGIELRFNVIPVPQMIIVGEYEGRYFLKAGMHRAFVLAQAGYQDIPCFIVRETEMPTISGPYPAYGPDIMKQLRPPLLLDAFQKTFTTQIRYRRTNRVLRIASEDFSIPVE